MMYYKGLDTKTKDIYIEDGYFKKIADSYDEEIERSMNRTVSVLEPTLVIILSIVVCAVLGVTINCISKGYNYATGKQITTRKSATATNKIPANIFGYDDETAKTAKTPRTASMARTTRATRTT